MRAAERVFAAHARGERVSDCGTRDVFRADGSRRPRSSTSLRPRRPRPRGMRVGIDRHRPGVPLAGARVLRPRARGRVRRRQRLRGVRVRGAPCRHRLAPASPVPPRPGRHGARRRGGHPGACPGDAAPVGGDHHGVRPRIRRRSSDRARSRRRGPRARRVGGSRGGRRAAGGPRQRACDGDALQRRRGGPRSRACPRRRRAGPCRRASVQGPDRAHPRGGGRAGAARHRRRHRARRAAGSGGRGDARSRCIGDAARADARGHAASGAQGVLGVRRGQRGARPGS